MSVSSGVLAGHRSVVPRTGPGRGDRRPALNDSPPAGVTLYMRDTLWQDLKYAARGLRRQPAFATAVVLTLALGIGANSAMFAIVDRMLFRPPPMLIDPANAHRVYFYSTSRGTENISGSYQYARYIDLATLTSSFSRTAGYSNRKFAVGVGEAARDMQIGVVSASFFSFFKAPPALGRYFTASEDSVPAGSPVAVLSYAMWETNYGSKRDVLGTKIQIGPTIYTVIGVAPSGFVGLWPDQPPAAFIPITNYAASSGNTFKQVWWKTYNWGWMSMIAQRKPGVSIAAANADLSRAAQTSYRQMLLTNPRNSPIELAKPHASIASILAERGPKETSTAKVATWVAGVSFIVLLIACANVANLLLARALRRRREIAVRLALGVSRSRLLSQLLTESVLLAVLGGIAGVFVAQWSGGILRAHLLPKTTPDAVLRDPRTLLFAGGAALCVGLLTGLAPALQATRSDVAGDLKAGSREGTYHRSRTRTVLLVLQCALSVILLVGAGLFVRSLRNVQSVRLGYDTEPVVMVDLNMRGVQLDSTAKRELRERLMATVKATPGVENASYMNASPFWSYWNTYLFVDGIDTVARLGEFDLNAVSPGYFATLGTRVIRGRGFTDDDRAGARRVAVVAEAMGKRLWPGKDPLGQCIKVNADTMPCTYVVGIAEDIKSSHLAEETNYYYYLPYEQNPGTPLPGLFVRVHGNAGEYLEAIRRRLQREMPGAAYVTTTPFRDVLSAQMSSWNLGATMFAAFGALALVLAAVGLYSVIAYNVTQRTHELGVRIALGAQTADVIRLVASDALKLAAAGVAFGAGTSLIAAKWVKPLLFNESARDPAVIAVVSVLLVSVAAAASWAPARRASRVDPQVALRTE
jgi:putative ABC transport system permease protein